MIEPDGGDDEAQYERIEKWCQQQIKAGSDFLFDPKLFRQTLESKSKEWGFAFESLHSFIRNLHVYHVKVTAPQVQRNMSSYVQDYVENGASIKSLSQRANYPPYLFSRYIVERVAVLPNGKKGLTAAMRDPSAVLGNRDVILPELLQSEEHRRDISGDDDEQLSTTTRLAIEVQEAISADPLYGPEQDRKRHMIGIEYEVVLEDMLQSMDIPFESETQLREKGSSRTPDVLLQCPIGIQVGREWRVVCWIDSKALYGDVGTHRTSVLSQAESYVHRFGPGMILYWFGHAPLSKLGTATGDLVIQGWELPNQFLWPTGELGHRPNATKVSTKDQK